MSDCAGSMRGGGAGVGRPFTGASLGGSPSMTTWRAQRAPRYCWPKSSTHNLEIKIIYISLIK